MKDQTLLEARRLYRLGFAIHWLHPKSKVPLEGGWTTGPRKKWSELEETYQPGFNVGVRLGSPSKLKTGFLAVVDVDVKSKDPRHVGEALEAAQRVLAERPCPVVRSGRGNGSRHYYCCTVRPFKTFNPAQSDEIVRYLSPSKKASKKEIEELGKAKTDKGWRLGRAWEVSLYSDGRQVVLPPSIHPDSGEAYSWSRPLDGADSLPLIEFELPAPVVGEIVETTFTEAPKSKEKADFEFTPDEGLDIRWLPGISESMRAKIVEGTGVEDRSAFLLPAATALFSAGLDKDGVLSVLTDPTTFLGACAYEHAQTKNRIRAAKWLWRYTVRRVSKERNARGIFADAPVENAVASDDERAATDAEFADRPELRGFYALGPKGAMIPEYDALLKVFSDEYPFKTIADMKAVFTFNGTHYVDITPIEIKGFTEEKLAPKPEEKMRNEFLSKILANNIVRRTFFTETTEGKINFGNGVLDLSRSSRKLIAHSPDFGFRGVLPYGYDRAAKCPTFRKWLRSIMLKDDALVSILQEYMGYVVRGGDYKYHKALWLGGVGRNGKSTFVDLLKALIGVRNFSVMSIRALMTDKFASAALDGMIANFSEETSPQELADSGPFKNLTGDGDLTAQKKYGDPYSFRNRAKLIMTYNQIPDLKDLSKGMLSRPLIVPFLKVIEEGDQDRNIKAKLMTELPGIFNFALEGWERLEMQGGFTSSIKSELALEMVRQESCPVYQWVEHRIVRVENDEEGIARTFRPVELYDIYCKTEKHPFNLVSFGRRLNAHPLIPKHRKRTSGGFVYFGINVR